MPASPKPLVWIGTTLEDLKAFPEEARAAMGYALHQAQTGGKHPDAKPLKGFGGAGVLEVVEDHDGNTFRAVYTVKLAGFVYALHAFQKKSRKGARTAQSDIEQVRSRLKIAEEDHAERLAAEKQKEEADEEDE